MSEAAVARPTAGAGELLRVEELVIDVGGARAVDGVSLAVPRGAAVGLVGESGSGKTLTALAVLGLLPPAARRVAGRVLFEGRDLAALPEPALRRLRGDRLAMVFQEPATALNPVYPVGAQVAEALRLHRGLSRRAALAEAAALLEAVGIPAPRERLGAYPHELSGGMRQRVLLAAALACRPALLIADEPTSALDVTVQAQILELLARLRGDLGMALLLITHDLGVVAASCDEVVVLYAGRVVEHGATAALFAAPRHPYTAGLLASVPTLGAGAARLAEIPGVVPPPGRRPPGCAFSDRCDRARDDCRAREPALDGGVRCWHPLG